MTHEEQIRSTKSVDTLTAVLWCREVSATVCFEKVGGKVTIYVGTSWKCRDTFLEAVLAFFE